MTATNASPVYMMPDPNPSTEEEVLNALARAAQADSMEDLFEAIREITLLTSYCWVPINTDFLETDRKAVTWNETQALMEQWSHRCYNPGASIRTRCRMGVLRVGAAGARAAGLLESAARPPGGQRQKGGTTMPGIVIHTDGSCHGNPGPGGYAAIIQTEVIQEEDTAFRYVKGNDPSTTNNRMEMTAVIEGLTRLSQIINITDGVEVEIRTDSEYVCNGFNKGWITKWQQNGWRTSGKKAVANQELWEKLLQLTQGTIVTFTHVRGHAGDPMNELCDQIANEEALKAGREGSENQQAPAETTAGSPEVSAKIPEASENADNREYARGYADGYEAAKREMANALNSLRSHPTTEIPDNLPFHRPAGMPNVLADDLPF